MDMYATFRKAHEHLICIDSDGCAMDTMELKHFQCFGPKLIEAWHLEIWQQKLLQRWNEINLYSMTRGINRFKALVLLLSEVDTALAPIPDLPSLRHWTEESPELSERSLREAISREPEAEALRLALTWSEETNRAITQLPDIAKTAFPGVLEALVQAHADADIAVVSSANLAAVREEWEKEGLLSYTDLLLTQEAGSKSSCIHSLLSYGYDPDKVLMIGDAPGDRKAAEEQGIHYFPILARHEATSWESFRKTGLPALLSGQYAALEPLLIKAFLDNLSGNGSSP